ncbi:phosphoenolpyruvate--protein phosphotransferase [Sessilibacter corallicola]|uniref:phosphoenolpyruvate--protein phosphotransferase n=1 Tax=Sessilibacter corallicola TaxID=2904075 RepID=A0ABQ0A8F5_9GAMM|nr:phosphoenolpyruvate--protein phosphotransferase [Sessilibacter corallicola]MCE2030405.1 phosphoenolpyruvate--protein phosphotransferase [Sessilibacter corallicola]
MLHSLRTLVQEVNSTHDLHVALDIIVQRVREIMQTDVCSIYLRTKKENYQLMATEGLMSESVGQVVLGFDEGLVGWVVARAEPINLENAAQHPRYQYFPVTGEEKYQGFLGAPIIHHREVLGVLVVQQSENRKFDESEEAFLVTVSAQLAGVIAHAEATGALGSIGSAPKQARFSGVSCSGGVALGEGVVVTPPADLSAVAQTVCDDPDSEIEFLLGCMRRAKTDIEHLAEQLKGRLSAQEQALFDVYLAILDDATIIKEVTDRIHTGESATWAWSQVILNHVAAFTHMDDAYLSERASDLRDLGRRVLGHLQQSAAKCRIYPDNTILVGEELTASILGEVPQGRLAGVVSVQGSSNSHVAILARAMGIPTIMGAVDLPYIKMDQRSIIVDGYRGLVITDPVEELVSQYQHIAEEEKQLVEGLEAITDLPCETLDNHRVALWVNTGLMADVMRSLERGAEGVGLYRTEVPFLLRDRFPSEEEQRKIYREQLKAFHPNPVTMRTLDIGGDKSLPYFPIEEANPFLGWRGIRVTLDHPEIFLSQIRAMLKASEGLDNLRIMLPMISSVSELESAQVLIYRAFHELLDENYAISLPPIGVMVEVPAAVYQARELAARVDFLSVGSNDLTQYLLAVDRNNGRVAGMYESLHPAVLRALKDIVEHSHSQGTPVSICGELAGDPGAAMLLVAMGYDVLSMNATNLPKVKAALRAITVEDAEELLAQVIEFPDAPSVNHSVDEFLKEAGVYKLLRTPAATEDIEIDQ